jgi:RHS repeat-associated protein
LGVRSTDIIVKIKSTNALLSDSAHCFSTAVGAVSFEQTNHLGDVVVTLSDKVLGADVDADNAIDYYKSIVKSASLTYPFGWDIPNRKFTAGEDYRFGFNGQEIDKSIFEGAVCFKYRLEDPRVARFFSPDPIESKYPELTPYQVASNNPIAMVELEGLEGVYGIAYKFIAKPLLKMAIRYVVKNILYPKTIPSAPAKSFPESMVMPRDNTLLPSPSFVIPKNKTEDITFKADKSLVLREDDETLTDDQIQEKKFLDEHNSKVEEEYAPSGAEVPFGKSFKKEYNKIRRGEGTRQKDDQGNDGIFKARNHKEQKWDDSKEYHVDVPEKQNEYRFLEKEIHADIPNAAGGTTKTHTHTVYGNTQRHYKPIYNYKVVRHK